MSVVSVKARSFILALFIRDDGERFLLGDNGFDFKDSQLHFSANAIENDEVAKQGVDGVMLAGQVRRASVQSFDGYVGDATTLKEEVEQMRRDFIAFFAKGHHFRVVYVDTARNAWQRKGGYLVDAPEVKELYQIHPEYHVGLNFEDVSYYSYNENSDGDEILANTLAVPVSTDVNGGLVWDEDGAVSEPAVIEYDTETAEASGKSISISDAAEAPLASFQLDGETSQNGTPTPDAPVPVQTVSGEQTIAINSTSYKINLGKNLLPATNGSATISDVTFTKNSDGSVTANGTASAGINYYIDGYTYTSIPAGTYTLSDGVESGESDTTYFTCLDGSPNYNSTIASPTFTATTAISVRARIVIRSGVHLDNVTFKVQLEKGSQATSYAPYFTPIELCKIGDYQDYIYKDGSDWKIHKATAKVILNGTEYWGDGGIPNVKYTDSITNYATSENSPFSSSFAGVSNVAGAGAVPNDNTIAFINRNDVYRFYIKSSVASSVDAVKTWLSSNNLFVYYALATPTDTEITNEALITQLNALLNNARTYAGVNNIFTVTPNEQGTLEIGYYTKYKPMVVSGGYVWEDGGSGGPTIVTNESISAVSPVWTVFGPALNPMIENTTTGEQIQYVGMVGEGQTLVVDMGEQTARLDGLNVISNIVGEYLTLAPGSNTLLFSADSDAPASEIGWSEIVG